ncbi:MAG: Fe-S cluster assembly protein SufD [Aquisalimonadaceae bacterium]
MEAASEQKSVYLQEHEALPAVGPAWFMQRRRDAMAAFERQGFPDRRLEAWKNANLTAMTQQHFTAAAAGGVADGGLAAVAALVPEALRLVFVDGHFSTSHSDLSSLPTGLRVQSIASALAAGDSVLEAHYGRYAEVDTHPFAALNTAFAEDGVLIDVAPGTVVDMPVVLVFLAGDAVDGKAVYPRVLVRAGSGSEIRLVQHHAGTGTQAYVSCPVVELVVEANAGVQLQHLQEEAPKAWHLGVVHAELGRDARFNLHTVSTGARYGRTDVYVNLNGSGAQAAMNGLYLVNDGQHMDYHTWVRHRAEHGTSQQMFKGILDGKGQSVFDGMIHVAEGAQKTDSQQQNRNLLLSRRALARSNPRLEIYADDVKCAHGSTVGQLDPDALFYMRSRGIGEQEAKGLLTFAFANEVLESIALEPLREHVRERLFALLPGNETVRKLV